ncbi:MAG TPA: N-acetylmuramoyl-L-alanine amidase [Candidatus Udaeobacter sp.]
MKRAIRNVLGVAGLLLMMASLLYISVYQEKRPAVHKESKATQPQTSKPFAVVVLDPGHGGKDSGAMCGGVMEKDLTLDIARRVDRLLDSEGVATSMTRVGDSFVSLADRAAFGNRAKQSIFISIHFNEDNKPVASGVETYYAAHQIDSGSAFASWLPFFSRPPSSSPKPESQSLAGFIQEALVARTRSVDRGTQAKQFFVIANVTSPAVLIEAGFITNKDELSKLVSEDYRDQLAAAVADGVLRYRDALAQQKSAVAATRQRSTE